METLENILVIQTAFLGDSVLTLPMLEYLKGKFPKSQISILCIPASSELFYHAPYVDEVIVYDKKGSDKSFSKFLQFAGTIRSKKFTRVYSPHRSARSIFLGKYSGAKELFCFDNASLSFLFNRKIKYNERIHEVARNLELAGFDFKTASWRIKPKVTVSLQTEKKIEQFLSGYYSKKFVAIAPGSVWKTKVYPKEYFMEVAKYLLQKGFKVVVIGGEKDRFLCQEFEDRFNGYVKSYANELTVIESVQLLKQCSLLISNDSAPTHLGMAADIPVLTIYCSTVHEFGFYPYNDRSESVSFDDLKCKPCGIHGHEICPIKTFECGYKLTPDKIIAKITSMLSL